MKRMKRVYAGLLAFLIAVSSVPDANISLAKETENKDEYCIESFNEVENRAVSYGTPESKIGLPNTLQVKFANDTEEEEGQDKEQVAITSESPSTEEHSSEHISETSETYSETVVVPSEVPIEDENKVVEDTDTDTVLLPVNQAEPSTTDILNLKKENSLEETQKQNTEVTERISIPVKWICENYDGRISGNYTFCAEWEETEYQGHKLILADDVMMPEIVVTVKEAEAITLSQELDGMIVTVNADAGVFPQDVSLHVSKVLQDLEVKEIDQAIEEVRDEERKVNESYTFDIRIEDEDGNEIEPDNTKGSVQVSFAMSKILDDNRQIDVYHVKENENEQKNLIAEALDVNKEEVSAEGTNVNGEETLLTVETDSFSYYVVEFTVGELQYVLDGDESIALSTILDSLNLSGTVTQASGTNDTLFTVTPADGEDWIVTAKQAFSSTESLFVTINDVKYEIAVTDSAQKLIAYYDFDAHSSTNNFYNTVSQSTTNVSVSTTRYNNSSNYGYYTTSGLADNSFFSWGSANQPGFGFQVSIGEDCRYAYSIAMRFAYTDAGPGYRKIVDYSNFTDDTGFYLNDNQLMFYKGGEVARGTTEFRNNQIIDLVVTRNMNTNYFTCYSVVNENVTKEFSWYDSGYQAAGCLSGSNTVFGFLRDDPTNVEFSTGGAIYSLKIWDYTLSEEEIKRAADPVGIIYINNGATYKTVSVTPGGNSTTIAAPSAATGATFKYWKGSNGYNYSAGADVSNVQTALTMTAEWGYAVTYNGNQGTSASTVTNIPTKQEKLTSNTLTLTNTVPIKNGYQFTGWNTKADGTGTTYQKGGTYTTNAPITLYAMWTPLKYNVSLTGTNVLSDSGFGTAKATYEQSWTGKIKPDDNYYLPKTISIYSGNNALLPADYTYNQVTGAITIKAEKVLGNIAITANSNEKVFTKLTITEGKSAANGGMEMADLLSDDASGSQLIPGRDYYLNAELNKLTGVEYVQVQYGVEGYNGVTFTNPPGGVYSAGSINHDYLDKLTKYTDWTNPGYGSGTARLALTDGTLIYHMDNNKEDAKFVVGLNINDAVYNGSGSITDAISTAVGTYQGGFNKVSSINLNLNVASKNMLACRMTSKTSTSVLDEIGNTCYAYAITNNSSDAQTAALFDTYQVDVVYPKNAELSYGFNTNFDKNNATYGKMTISDASSASSENTIQMQKRTITIVNGLKTLTATTSIYFRLDFKSATSQAGKYTLTMSNPRIRIGGVNLPENIFNTTGNMKVNYTVTKGGTDSTVMSAMNRNSIYNQSLVMEPGSYMVPLGSAYIKNGSDAFASPYEKTFEAQYNTTNAAANVSCVLVPLGTDSEPEVIWEGKNSSGSTISGTLTKEQISEYAYVPGNVEGSQALLLFADKLGIESFTKITAKIGCIRKGYASSGWTSGWNFSYNYAGSFGYFTDGSDGTVVKNTFHLFNTDEAFRDQTGGDLTVSTTATSTTSPRAGLNGNSIKLGKTTLKTDSSVAAGQIAKISGSIYPYYVVQASYRKDGSTVTYADSMMLKGVKFYLKMPYGITPNDENNGIAFKKTTYSYNGKSLESSEVGYDMVQVGSIENGITTYLVTLDSNECIGYYDANGNYSTLNYTLSFNTDESLTTQRYRLNDLIKLVTDNKTEFLPYANVNSGTLVYVGEDYYQLNDGKTVAGIAKDKDDNQVGFGVQQLADISVQSAISVSKINDKPVDNQEWYAYNISNPNSIAMLGQKSEGQIRLSINNTSDNTAKDLVLVLPIPQMDMNLGKLMMDNQQGFTVDMTDALQGNSADGFTISYGKIVGSYGNVNDFFDGVNSYTEVESKEEANALIIRSEDLEKGIYDLYFNYVVKDGGVDTVDIWRPIYEYKINDDTRRKAGSYIASSIAGSEICGVVFADEDRNKCMDESEQGIEGVVITAKDTQGRTISTITDADGKYKFDAVRESIITMIFTLSNGQTYRFNVGALDSGENMIATSVIPAEDGLSATQQLYISGTGNMVNAAVSDYLTLVYDGNASTAGSLPKECEYVKGETATVLVKPDNLVKTGNRFVCWNTQADGKGTDYLPGNTFEMNSNTVLYAKWTTASYLVTFNYRGATGENSESSRTLLYNSYYGGTTTEYKSNVLPKPLKNGYLFKGWATTATTTSVISNSTRFRTGADLILYAVWTEKADYKVHYDTKEGTALEDKTVAYTGNVLPDIIPTKTGYQLKAWKYNNNELTKEDTFNRLAGTTSEITLTAVWEPKSGYIINYNTAGGKESITAKEVRWTDTGLLPQGNPTRDGYAFDGWNYGEKTVTMSDTFALLADSDAISAIELTATWTELSDNMVKYNTDGGTAIKDKNGVKASDMGLIPAEEPVKAGYRFTGWKYGATSVTTNTQYSSLTEERSVTLTAEWEEKQYAVKYTTNTNKTIAPKNAKWTDTTLIPETVLTKTGYQFAGWYYGDTKVNYSTTISTLLPEDKQTEVVLTALWTEKSYTVVYDSNDGSYIMPKNNVFYKNTNIISDVAPVKTGYSFTGWYVNQTQIMADTSLDNALNLVEDGAAATKITLKAHWSAKTGYYLGYNTDGGTIIADRENVSWDDKNLLPTINCEKTGYILNGWLVGRKAVTKDTTYAELATLDTEGSKITMVAQWQEKADYRLIFHTECDTQLSDRTGIRWTEKQLLPSTILKMTGYAFKGWKLSNGTSVNNYDDYKSMLVKAGKTESTKDLELYAVWEEKDNYIVSYDTDGAGAIADKNGISWTSDGLIPMEIPQKEGYQFTGWYANGKKLVSKTKYQDIAEDDTVQSVTVTAHWNLKTYQINYVTGTEDLIEPKTNLTWIDANLIPEDELVKTGYDLKGWYFKNTKVLEGDCLQSLLMGKNIPESIILEADWELHAYTIALQTNTPGYTIIPVDGMDATALYQSEYDVVVELKDGYSKTDDYAVYAKKTGDADANAVMITADPSGICHIANITSDMTIFVKGVADLVAPTGEIILGTNHWNRFLNKVTFGIFFDRIQNVTILAEDIGSGVKGIQYYVSEQILTADTIKEITESDWKSYQNSFSMEPDKASIIYVKITDESGNTTYLNSDGVIIDQTTPVIEGVENQGTYHGSQRILIHEKNLDSVTINGAEVIYALDSGYYTLNPSAKPYQIVARDKVGNITDYTVTVDWIEVVIPQITDQEYTGENQKALISNCADYSIIGNDGGTEVDNYEVILSLNDTAQNRWAGKKGSIKEATTSFRIVAVANKFINGLSCEDTIYGIMPNPSAVSKYGTVTYKYSDSANGTFTNNVPTQVGTYYVKGYVAGTADYEAISSEAVSFRIDKAVYEAPVGISAIGETITGKSDGRLTGVAATMEYSIDNGEHWESIGGTNYSADEHTQKNLAAGTYQVRLKADESHTAGETVEVTILSGRKLIVKFEAAGSTDVTREVFYDSTIAQNDMPSIPDKKGYEGTGWCVGQTRVTELTHITEDTEVTALYEPTIVTITLQNGTGAEPVTGDSIYLKYENGYYKNNNCESDGLMNGSKNKVSIPTRENYIFLGYYTTVDGTGNQYIGADGYLTAGAKLNAYTNAAILYAVWKEYTYVPGEGTRHSIIYKNDDNTEFDGAFLSSAPGEFNENEGIELPQAEKTGYEFAGWYTEETYALENKITRISSGTTSDMTVYAKWTPISYSVTFHENGGSIIPEKKMTTYVFSNTTSVELPVNHSKTEISKEGFTFDGWYTNRDLTGSRVTEITAGSVGTKEFYAKWCINKHTITAPLGEGYLITPINQVNLVEHNGNYSFTVTEKTGYSKSNNYKVLVKNETDEDTQAALLAANPDGSYTIKNVNADKTILVKGIVDQTAPQATITVRDNKFNRLLNTITFGLFFKNTQQIHISSIDTGSGVKLTKYRVSDKKLGDSDLKNNTGWTTFDNAEGGSFNQSPESTAIVYVYTEDQEQNGTYICSDGMIFETSVPCINGITDGEIRVVDGDVNLSVTDLYLSQVKVYAGVSDETGVAQTITGVKGVADKLPTANVTLQAPASGEIKYRIWAKDEADNQITYTITLKRADYNFTVGTVKFDPVGYGYADVQEKAITLSATGNSDVTISSVNITGSNANAFVLNKTSGMMLPKGTVNKTTYSIRPKSGLPAGIYRATLSVTENKGNKVDTEIVFTVEQKEAVIRWGETKFIYNGTKPLLRATVENLQVGDNCSVTVVSDLGVAAGTYADKAVATALSNPNYKLPQNSKITYVIQKAELTDITITPYRAMLDSSMHDAITKIEGILPSDQIQYYVLASDQWTGPYTKVPQVGSAGATDIRVDIERENYQKYEKTVTAIIEKGPAVSIGVPAFDETDVSKVTVSGSITQGDYTIASSEFVYRKSGEANWLPIVLTGNKAILTELKASTVYEMRLSATDINGNTATETKTFQTNMKSGVTGKITGSVSGEAGAVFSVSLERGNTVISGITGLHNNDTFQFINLSDGEYNLVVTDGTNKVTNKVTVKNGQTTELSLITIGVQKTSVKIEPGAPDIAVGGLGNIFDTEIVQGNNSEAAVAIGNGGTVEIRMTADASNDNEAKNRISSVAGSDGNQVGLYTEIRVDMIITPPGEPSTVQNLTDTEKYILIALPIPLSLQGKSNYRIYRYHNGEIQEIPELPVEERENPSREGFYIEGSYAYIWARYFSTYAITYDKPAGKPNDNTINDMEDTITTAQNVLSIEQATPTTEEQNISKISNNKADEQDTKISTTDDETTTEITNDKDKQIKAEESQSTEAENETSEDITTSSKDSYIGLYIIALIIILCVLVVSYTQYKKRVKR